ncbi:MAG: zinc-binding dehydrogenase [Rhodothermales bacterium]|nr:zinc-binding dehydrogenase [Rhodothermales bacterium]
MIVTKAVVFTGPNQVEYRDVSCPDPGPDDVVVRTTHSWISNGTEGSYLRGERSDGDTPFAEGDPLPFPVIAGYQKIGIVDSIGANVDHVKPGQQVFCTIGRVDGMHHWYAGQVAVSVTPKKDVWPIPSGVDPLAFAGLVLIQVGYNSGMRSPVEPGELAVVVGDGLVGHWTAQTLANRGARVVLVGRHNDRLAKVARKSEIMTINSRDNDWVGTIRDQYGETIAVGVDTVGSVEILNDLMSISKRFGHLVSAGFYGSEDALHLQPPRYRELSIDLVSGWTYERMGAALEEVASGRITSLELITHRFPANMAADAWALIESKSEPVLGVILDWSHGDAHARVTN